jgi:hypothetical protein
VKWLLILVLLFPGIASATVVGVDDTDNTIPAVTREKLDKVMTTYYQHPDMYRVSTVLKIMNSSDVLMKKTSWPVFVGFLTIVFGDNKNHVMHWISMYDYNSYAEDVMVTALLHAHLKETALVFAQAQQWKSEEQDRIRYMEDHVDLKHLNIALPGHIDTLWGAFFASGDVTYVNEIIEVLFMKTLSASDMMVVPPGHKMEEVLDENKKLAANSLKVYAASHKIVSDAIRKRLERSEDRAEREMLQRLLPEAGF